MNSWSRFAAAVCWRCPVTSVPSAAHLTVSLLLCSSRSDAWGKPRALEGRLVSSKKPFKDPRQSRWSCKEEGMCLGKVLTRWGVNDLPSLANQGIGWRLEARPVIGTPASTRWGSTNFGRGEGRGSRNLFQWNSEVRNLKNIPNILNSSSDNLSCLLEDTL